MNTINLIFFFFVGLLHKISGSISVTWPIYIDKKEAIFFLYTIIIIFNYVNLL